MFVDVRLLQQNYVGMSGDRVMLAFANATVCAILHRIRMVPYNIVQYLQKKIFGMMLKYNNIYKILSVSVALPLDPFILIMPKATGVISIKK